MYKFSNMSLKDKIKLINQVYELYAFLNNAKDNDTTISNFFSNNNINKDDLLQNLNKENVIAIYNSLSPDQKQKMKQFTGLFKALFPGENFTFDENNTSEQNNEVNNSQGGRSRRRRSKRRRSKRKNSKRRKSRK